MENKSNINFRHLDDLHIAVIGLGYVGLPLAVEFSKSRKVIGFDVDEKRISDLRSGIDTTLEVNSSELVQARYLELSSDLGVLEHANCYIVTVPTPIDSEKRPNLSPLYEASETVGRYLGRGDIVIYESTVYPGATEEDCVPILEAVSGFTFNKDFYVGYSPERINPGDHLRRLPDILKVTSGSTLEVADLVDRLYASIIIAGTYKAESIKVAEAAKVIENTQRDINIALMNELSIIFGKMGIDTQAVLNAAGTKWNFLKFQPGLVGGHCIGVDPYYLTSKAQKLGYHPEIILAGRRLNDQMGSYIAHNTIKGMLKKKINLQLAKILIMGITFKENCPDLRNSRTIDIITELKEYGVEIDVYDPNVSTEQVFDAYGLTTVNQLKKNTYDAVIISVAHNEFRELTDIELRQFLKPVNFVYDVKSILSNELSDLRL